MLILFNIVCPFQTHTINIKYIQEVIQQIYQRQIAENDGKLIIRYII